MYGNQGGGGGYGSGMDQGRRNEFVEGKVFLGGLDATVSKEAVQEYCMQWGAVKDAVVLQDKGFGFVTFEDPKVAQSFLEQREHNISGKKIDVKAGVPKSAGGTGLTKKMFVGGTGEITDDDFRQYFAQFGEIEDAAIARKDGISRGFGFVTYTDEISVEKALVMAHHLPNGKRVELKRAVPKEQMGGGGGGRGGFGGGYGGRGGGYTPRGGYNGGGGGGYGGGAGAGGGYGAGAGGYGGRGGGMAAAGAGGYGMQAMGGYGGYGMQAMAGYGAMGYGGAAMGGYGGMAGMGGYGGYGAPAGGAGAMGGYGRSPALGRGGGGRGQARYRPY